MSIDWQRARGLCAALAISALAASAAAAAEHPNIVILFADDLGYGDLGCYGNAKIRTPSLDRMAKEGMRFTDFYSAAEVCTPSRAALLTGRYPVRSGLCHDQFRVLHRDSTGGLPASEITLAEALKGQGYATACIGKWHLGNYAHDPAHHPRRHGFDYYYGLPHSNDMNPTPAAPKGATARLDQQAEWWDAPLYRNEEQIERPADQTTLTRRYAAEAVKFIQGHADGPFFLYLPFTFPHVPLFASPEFRGRSAGGLYGDVIEEIDAAVGTVLDALRRGKLAERTFVFFTSDNGPWLTMGAAGGTAGPLRDGKGSTWEGGMRVPGIAWWPGRIPAGRIEHGLACTMDLFTTSLKLAGAAAPADRPMDGLDLAPVLFGAGRVERDVFLYYRGATLYAARQGPWKAHYITRSAYGRDGPETHDPPLLFNLADDIGETNSVAGAHAEVLRTIGAAVERHRAALKPAASQLVGRIADKPSRLDNAPAVRSP